MRSVLSLATFYIGRVSSLRTYTVCSVPCYFSEIRRAPILRWIGSLLSMQAFTNLILLSTFDTMAVIT